MIAVKTIKLEGKALDWAVAICQGAGMVTSGEHTGLLHWPSPKFGAEPRWSLLAPEYSTDWAIGGPLIEETKITVGYDYDCKRFDAQVYIDNDLELMRFTWGPTFLIAAMRCYVAIKFEHEIEVPNCLLSLKE